MKNVPVDHEEVFRFVCEWCSSIPKEVTKEFKLEYIQDNSGFDDAFKIESSPVIINNEIKEVTIMATANFERGDDNTYAVGNIGTLKCYV